MVIENDPSARIKVVSVGQLGLPATCVVCGSGTCEAGYVDIGVFVDYHGNLYFCVICATQLGETIGLYTPEEVKLLRQVADDTLAKLQETQEELDRVKPIADALANYAGISDLLRADSHINSFGMEVGTVPAEDSAEPVSRTDGGESEPEEPTLSVGRRSGDGSPKLRDITFD